MKNNLPPELVTQIIELLHVAGGILIGWVAKWLQRKQPKPLTNEQSKKRAPGKRP